MRRQQWGLYAIALAILVVGLATLGVPASTLLIAALVLVCPVMMFVIMRGMHGIPDGLDRHDAASEDPRSPAGPEQPDRYNAGRG